MAKLITLYFQYCLHLLCALSSFEKCRRRLAALAQKNLPQEKKDRVKKLLKNKEYLKYVSRDEELEDSFVSHPFSWESDELSKIKSSLYKKYLETCPSRSRRLLVTRTRGEPREETCPNVDPLLLLGCCFTPYQRLRLYNGAPFSRLLRHTGDTEDVFSA